MFGFNSLFACWPTRKFAYFHFKPAAMQFKTTRMRILIFPILLFTISICHAQKTSDLIGLWTVSDVTVGQETMTPIARWFEFRKDFTQRSGNGWQQHTTGSWSFDEENVLFSATNDNGIVDDFGPFKVKLDGKTMTWQRQEDGMTVTVKLEKANEIPASHADLALGLWQLKDQGEKENATLFMRWDRHYIFRNTTGKNTSGVWQPHAHRAEIQLISDQGDALDERWNIRFENNRMIWEKDGKQREFERIFRFPE